MARNQASQPFELQLLDKELRSELGDVLLGELEVVIGGLKHWVSSYCVQGLAEV